MTKFTPDVSNLSSGKQKRKQLAK
uniref:Uncharacterized protein n=1 Tax=Arundo donax TaxID=35708 RepID=A0A0A9APV7_ARUDO